MTDSSKPSNKPMIFAIMRNGHEVLRGALAELQDTLDRAASHDGMINPYLDMAVKDWHAHHKWVGLHMAMEEGCGEDKTPRGFFRLLDMHCDSVASNAHLHEAHEQLVALEQAVEQAFQARNVTQMQTTFTAFRQADEAHLKQEEAVMMPQVQKMVKAGHPMKKYMRDEMFAAIPQADREFFITHAAKVLERHSSPDAPRFVVFFHALWAIADKPDEWQVWKAWIQQSVSPETFASLEQVIAA